MSKTITFTPPGDYKVESVEFTLSGTEGYDLLTVAIVEEGAGVGHFVELKDLASGVRLNAEELTELARQCADLCEQLDAQNEEDNE